MDRGGLVEREPEEEVKDLLGKGQEDETMTHLVHEDGSKNLEFNPCTILDLMLILLINKIFCAEVSFKLSFKSLLIDIWLVLVVMLVRHIILAFMKHHWL